MRWLLAFRGMLLVLLMMSVLVAMPQSMFVVIFVRYKNIRSEDVDGMNNKSTKFAQCLSLTCVLLQLILPSSAIPPLLHYT